MLGTLTCAPRHPEPVVPANVYEFAPPAIYEQWAAEAQSCVLNLDALDVLDTLFTVERRLDATSYAALHWFAVPTQRLDGAYPCRNGDLCYGTQVGDSLFISVQALQQSWVIEHEIMHIIVKSAGEQQSLHGLPWGFCEYN